MKTGLRLRTDSHMLAGATKLVRTCARTQPGDHVVIVTDYDTMTVAEALAEAAESLGAEAVICVMAARAEHGQEPPLPIAAALLSTDVFFTPVKVSITHTRAIQAAIQSGARGLVMTGFTPHMLMRGGIEADFAGVEPLCRRLASIFESARNVHLASPAGTNLYLDATGRRGNGLTGIVSPGEFTTVPTIEANFSPVEGSAEGIIVADASIPYLDIGLLRDPVRLLVSNGAITAIEGGAQAKRLREDLAQYDDPAVYNVAELGVGLNPKSQLCGLMLEDEGVAGIVHIGVGTNITLGGTVKAKIHYDVLMQKATMVIDGNTVLDRGQLVFN